MKITIQQHAALQLVNSGLGNETEDAARVIISRQAKSLLELGLITYGTGRKAYTLTRKGKWLLNEWLYQDGN